MGSLDTACAGGVGGAVASPVLPERLSCVACRVLHSRLRECDHIPPPAQFPVGIGAATPLGCGAIGPGTCVWRGSGIFWVCREPLVSRGA